MMMQEPLFVSVDPARPVGYIEYRNFDAEGHSTLRILRDPDEHVREYGRDDGRREEGTSVHLDLHADDEIVGLEIIDVDDREAVAIARDDAADNGLAFPADIRGAAAGRPAA